MSGEELDDLLDFLETDDQAANDSLESAQLSVANSDSFVTCRPDLNSTLNDTYVTTATSCSVVDDWDDSEEGGKSSGHNSTSILNDSATTSSSRPEIFDFMSASTKNDDSKMVGTLLDVEDEPVDDEMSMIKDLNSSGKNIQGMLSKQERELHLSKLVPAPPKPAKLGLDKWIEKVDRKPALSAFDSTFNIKIRKPTMSSLTFDSYIQGMKKLRCVLVKSDMEMSDWVTMGVIVDRTETRKSANGNEYIIWKIHDLMNCQETSLKVLLFGESCKAFWKLQLGATVALVNPQIADAQQNQSKTKEICVKVTKVAQVLEIGYCPSYGLCKGVRQDGQKCPNFVNLDLCETCVFHVMSEARKLSSKRGTFSSVSSGPPRNLLPKANKATVQPHGLTFNMPAANTILNSTGTIKVAAGNSLKPSSLKATSKTEEKETLTQIMSSRAHLLGAKNLMKLSATKAAPAISTSPDGVSKHGCMTDLIKQQKDNDRRADLVRLPTIGFGLRHGGDINLSSPPLRAKTQQGEAARLRAIAILKRKKETGGFNPSTTKGPLKRLNTDHTDGTPQKKTRSGLGVITSQDQIAALLNKKSMNQKTANETEANAAQKYLDGMESRERVETFVTGCMSMKNIKVISCKKCGYTAQKQSELCMQNGHVITRHTAEKRFFKCGGCKQRSFAFTLLPTKPCEKCDANSWERVAMRDERKVVLENEKLLVRGEERANVNN